MEQYTISNKYTSDETKFRHFGNVCKIRAFARKIRWILLPDSEAVRKLPVVMYRINEIDLQGTLVK